VRVPTYLPPPGQPSSSTTPLAARRHANRPAAPTYASGRRHAASAAPCPPNHEHLRARAVARPCCLARPALYSPPVGSSYCRQCPIHAPPSLRRSASLSIEVFACLLCLCLAIIFLHSSFLKNRKTGQPLSPWMLPSLARTRPSPHCSSRHAAHSHGVVLFFLCVVAGTL
jgi:hypothetical protein